LNKEGEHGDGQQASSQHNFFYFGHFAQKAVGVLANLEEKLGGAPKRTGI